MKTDAEQLAARGPTTLERAFGYLNRGWQPIDIPAGEKNPARDGWQNERHTADDLPKHFVNGCNVGILNGEPSGGIVDVDLDHPIARKLADQYLPPTDAVFGRASSERSHRVYRPTAPMTTKQYRLPKENGKAKSVVEIRSTGSQTIAPGSVHPEGERIEWASEGEPAVVAPGMLLACVEALYTAVKRELGIDESKPTGGKANGKDRCTVQQSSANVIDRARKYLAKVPPAVSNQGGHDHTFFAAQQIVNGFALDGDTALQLLSGWNTTCQPPWSERELQHKIDEAIKKPGDRGRGYMLSGDGRDWETRRGSSKPEESSSTMELDSGEYSETVSEYASRPKIDTSCKDLRTTTAQAWSALRAANEPPTLFRYGGASSRIEHGDKGEPIIRTLEFNRMRHHLARAAEWIELKRSGDDFVEKPTAPPKDVVFDVLATPDQPLPVLTRIVEAPVFASDGTLQTMPGYHPRSQTYYAAAAGFTIPDVPERPEGADIESARTLLCDELLGDFPFVGQAEIAHAVALLLLPFARDLIDGPTPLHLIEKPSPGTGATLMIDMLSLPATGRSIAAMTEGNCEEEWRKRITSKLRGGSAFLLIDNLRRRLDSAAVSSAITAPSWEDRILGLSEVARIPVRCAWVATGNNPAVSTEISRRTVRVRMDAKVDRPWLRDGFRHSDLRAWATNNRGLLVWAALTLIRAWIVAGKPKGNGKLGMFERWAEVVGGILNVAGIPGFLTNLEDFYESSDAEGQTWRDFLAAWWDRFEDHDAKVAELFEVATADVCLPLGDKGEQSQKIVLGKLLSEKRDRMFDLEVNGTPCRLAVRHGGTARRATLWKLQLV